MHEDADRDQPTDPGDRRAAWRDEARSPSMSTSPDKDMYFDSDTSYGYVRPDTGPITVTAMPYYVYQGELIPYGTDYRRVAIDVRNQTVHIASSNAAAGVFY